MKKTLALLLALLILLSLTACKENDKEKKPFDDVARPTGSSADATEPAATEPSSTDPVLTLQPPVTEEPTTGVEDLIYESYSDAGEYVISYDDGATDIFYYSFHLPHISESTQGAREINRSIDEHFGALIE